MRRRIPLALSALVLAGLTACTGAPLATAPPTSTGAPAPVGSPTVSATGSSLEVPESPSAEAVAYAEAGDGEVGTHVGPATDGSYVVRAACVGADRISYELVVDDTPVSSATFDCGAEVINTAFSDSAESVMIRFPDPPAQAEALAEVIPEDALGR